MKRELMNDRQALWIRGEDEELVAVRCGYNIELKFLDDWLGEVGEPHSWAATTYSIYCGPLSLAPEIVTKNAAHLLRLPFGVYNDEQAIHHYFSIVWDYFHGGK